MDDMAVTNIDNSFAFPAYFARAASPTRYMVERGDWKGAANLAVEPCKFPHVMAITHFARALGAARSGNPQAASVPLASEDSQIGVRMRVCLYGQDRTYPGSS
jgi:hypothetical protein